MDFYRIDPDQSYRPEVDIGKLLSIRPDYAVENYLSYLFKYIKNKDEEGAKIPQLSLSQRRLYCYYLIEGQVFNGGFVQAIYNDYLKYFPLAIESLEMIQRKECADLLLTAKEVAKRSQFSFLIARLKGLFNSNLYDQHKSLDSLDNEFYGMMFENNLLFRSYIWTHREEFMTDDSIPVQNADGRCVTFFQNGMPYQEYTLCADGLDKKYLEYYPSGKLKLEKEFQQGVFTGSSKELSENGELKTECYPGDGKLVEVLYGPNGKKEKLQTLSFNDFQADGKYLYWFDNGQLKIEGFRKKNRSYGMSKRYYENGQLEMVGRHEGLDFYIDNYFLPDGSQTIKNGRGHTKKVKKTGGSLEVLTTEYLNGLRNGSEERYVNGELQSKKYYRNGKLLTPPQ